MSDTIYTLQGEVQQTGNQSLEALLASLVPGAGNHEKPAFSWYEPRPESLIGTGVEPPLQTLRRGWPQIPDRVEYSELMLFYPQGGLTLCAVAGKWHYFYWSESPFDHGAALACHKLSPRQPVYLRTQAVLEAQYGVHVDGSDLYPENDREAGHKALWLIEYHKDGQRVAWTLNGGAE